MRRPSVAPTALAALSLVAACFLGAAPAAAAAPAGPQAIAVRGGDVLYGDGGATCVLGFNARRSTATHGLAAGHCLETSATWYADPARTVPVGVTAGVSFPADDYGNIRYTGTAASYPGEVSLGGGAVRDITGAAGARVGQSVCHVGRAGGLRCGTVTAVNVTVNYGGGAVHGLFRSTACTEPGDTGGPAFSGGTALGLVVGASGTCATGGVTYYQPVVEALSAYGLTLY